MEKVQRIEMSRKRKPRSQVESPKVVDQDITIYTVCLPSMVAWPPGDVVLHMAYSENDAQTYVDNYPNVFLRYSLKIVPKTLRGPRNRLTLVK
jgi:hypothetical protein